MKKAKSFYKVSLVGLGKMGLGYDVTDGQFAGTAKSHLGALMKIGTTQTLNLVELANPNLSNFLHFSKILLKNQRLLSHRFPRRMLEC